MIDTTNPGVQKPHCRPWASCRARCTVLSSPSGGVKPSIVVTSPPSAWTANMRQARTAAPSNSTVQAPHTPCSHPRCVPVSRQSSRRKSASVLRGSTAAVRLVPLIVTVIVASGTLGLLERLVPGFRCHGGADPGAVARRRVKILARVADVADGEPPDLVGRDGVDRLPGDGRFGGASPAPAPSRGRTGRWRIARSCRSEPSRRPQPHRRWRSRRDGERTRRRRTRIGLPTRGTEWR